MVDDGTGEDNGDNEEDEDRRTNLPHVREEKTVFGDCLYLCYGVCRWCGD